MKSSFGQFIESNPKVKAIFVGVRRSDPFCEKLHDFDSTDNGWPSFIRVHPILDWSYSNIWEYLRSTNTPYCTLYDEGFTSIGDKDRTIPNPNLKENSLSKYKPAYMLADESQERAGRIS